MVARLGVRATFALGTPDALPAGDGMFDAVLVRHLVSRLTQPHRALKEWLRVLRSGGRILLIDSFPGDRRWWSGLHRKLARTERERRRCSAAGEQFVGELGVHGLHRV